MKILTLERSALACFAVALGVAFTLGSPPAFAEAVTASIDDFSDPKLNGLGHPRIFVTDSSVGGQSSLEHVIEDGVLAASGAITPPRGQPGWASMALLLDAQGQAVDMSAYEGIRLRVAITAGNLSVSANSTDVTNFDFHAAPVRRQGDDGFQEVRIPFSSMKRAWSEQTPLNTSTLASISLVAYDMKPGAFDYRIEEISFY